MLHADEYNGERVLLWKGSLSATLHFKANNESDWHEVAVDGSQQYTDVPANTFAEGATTLDWYVVAIANTGTKVTSDTINVSTLDTLSTPVAVSPAGEYMDDAVQGITFVWQHQQRRRAGHYGQHRQCGGRLRTLPL